MRKETCFIFMGLASLCAVVLLEGCSSLVLFDPKGPIGDAERQLIIAAIMLMLVVVVPVFVMAFWFSRKYRATNTKSTYAPKWSYSAKIDLFIWLVPICIVAALTCLSWTRTHSLDPYKPIDSGVKALNIEAVSLDWKWLFIYPDQNIASVNQIVFPANVPLSFRITSDTVLASFFIPQLGSQIYAMAGRESRLHLMADEPGTYLGQNQQFSGRGYADMHFKAIAASQAEFQAWLKEVKQSPNKLDPVRYDELAKPGSDQIVEYFSPVTPGLFELIMQKYNPSTSRNRGYMNRESVSGE